MRAGPAAPHDLADAERCDVPFGGAAAADPLPMGTLVGALAPSEHCRILTFNPCPLRKTRGAGRRSWRWVSYQELLRGGRSRLATADVGA